MADAIDMGGLLGIDPEKWSAIMAAAGISPTDKADIRKQQALMAGFSLLGGRKGQELDAISRAGMGAVAYGQRATQDVLANKQQAFQNAAMLAKFQQAQQQAQAQAAREKQVAGIMSGGAPTFDMSNGRGPTPENAASISAPNPSQQYQQLAALYASNPEAAKKYIDISQSLRPKYSATPHTVIGPDGKPMLVQTSETDMPRSLPYQPAIESKSEDIGGRLQYRNPLTNQITGGADKTMSFSDKNAAARLQLSRNADARAGANTDAGKWVNDLARGIQINSQTGESRPITEGGQPIGNQAETKAKQSAGKALDIISEAKKLIGSATGSYGGAAFDKAAQVFGVSTEGATSTAQLQALEGALMLNQPRMEGPQSDKDVAVYKQMAGKIGDPTVPAAQKKAALDVIEKLHKRYAGVSDQFDYSKVPKGATYTAPDGSTRVKQ